MVNGHIATSSKLLSFTKGRRWDVNMLLIIYSFMAFYYSVHVYCALNIRHPTTNIALSIRTIGLLCTTGSVWQTLCPSMHISLRSPCTIRFWWMHQSASALEPKSNDGKSFTRRKPTMWGQGVGASVRPAALRPRASLAPPPTMGRIVGPNHACTVDQPARPPFGCSRWLYTSHGGPQSLPIVTEDVSDKENVFEKDLHH